MQKKSARLEDWYFTGTTLIGKVYNHYKVSLVDGDPIITSEVVRFDKENNEAETLNTIYKLGKPYIDFEGMN